MRRTPRPEGTAKPYKLGRRYSFAWCFPRILGGSHIGIPWQGIIIFLPWRAGAEEQGDEDEGHFSIFRI